MDLPMKHGDVSWVMLNYQRVCWDFPSLHAYPEGFPLVFEMTIVSLLEMSGFSVLKLLRTKNLNKSI